MQQQGIALDLAVASRRSLLVNRADLVATVSSDLKVTGSTAGGIDIAGPITIDRAEISVGGAQSAAFPTLEVREINKPGGRTRAAAGFSGAPAAAAVGHADPAGARRAGAAGRVRARPRPRCGDERLA